MGGMEIIPTLFKDIGWGSLLIINELFYPMMLYEFYANLQRGKIQTGENVVTSRVNGKNIAFEDRLLNSILETLYEHKKMNFHYIAVEHMLGTQSSSAKCLPYGCFLIEVFQHFKITFFGPNDHVVIGKIYNQNTFKRMGFSRNKNGKLIKGGQEVDSEKEEEEEGNEPEDVDEEESDLEMEEERFRR
ncbi:hypothetical protein M9H77_23415 [Catharanthus roseus]|uniref:Uncharacterized protein n=1 Tax=Catharanthus roseus TaxID=4058 RepID=A0ACC0ASU9_CATRO|nr:hypothetical protein M9H77_23415 [Catharanthus roseus]